MKTGQVQGNELLTEGIRSYLQALAAISEFRRIVEDEFHGAVEKHRSSIADSLNVEIKSAAIQSYRDPEKLARNFPGDWAAVGVRIPVGKSGCKEHAYYLGWWYRQANLVAGIIASMTFSERSTAPKALSALLATEPKREFTEEKGTVLLCNELKLNGIEQLPQVIDGLIGQWCAAWRDVGGVRKVLRA